MSKSRKRKSASSSSSSSSTSIIDDALKKTKDEDESEQEDESSTPAEPISKKAVRKSSVNEDEEEDKSDEDKDNEVNKKVTEIKKHIQELRKTEEALKEMVAGDTLNSHKINDKVAYNPFEKNTKGHPFTFLGASTEQVKKEGGDTKKIPAVKVLLKKEIEALELEFKEDAKTLIPCPEEAELAKEKSMDVEHLKSKKMLIRLQANVVKTLNENKEVADAIMKEDGMDDFFIQEKSKDAGKKYYGTVYFYELGYNNICNLWLVCHSCNMRKSAKDTIDWFKQTGTFGQAFIEHLKKENIIDRNGELFSSTDMGLLKEAAQKWFQEHFSLKLKLDAKIIKAVKPLKKLASKTSSSKDKGDEAHASFAIGFTEQMTKEIASSAIGSMVKEKSEGLPSSEKEELGKKVAQRILAGGIADVLDEASKEIGSDKQKMKKGESDSPEPKNNDEDDEPTHSLRR